MSQRVQEFIEHYGVKGMKWGVRKKPDPNRSASKWKERKDKERASKEGSGVQNKTKGGSTGQVKKKAKDLTDEELRSVVNRIQLEQQYNRLTQETKKKNAGVEFAKGILINVARTQVTNLVNKQVEDAIGAHLNRANAIRLKEAKGMSDADLAKVVRRSKLEKQFVSS